MKIMHEMEAARAIAKIAHAGQVDKAGEDYYSGHLLRVAASVSGYQDQAVAWLHDVIEDTDVQADDLLRLGFSECVVEAVVALSRCGGETYAEHIGRIVDAGGSALRVKRADVGDHLRDVSPLGESMVRRYRDAAYALA